MRGLEIVNPKQIPQRMQVALLHVKVHNTSENVLNKIRYY